MQKYPKHITKIRYTGQSLWVARLITRISRKNLSAYLGITKRELARFENGKDVIPQKILTELFVAGIKYIKENDI